jgi:uncharacterized SAM-binding protein YcdF (DUF218 family)
MEPRNFMAFMEGVDVREKFKFVVSLLVVGLLYILIMHTLITSEADEIPSDGADFLVVLGARLYGETPSPTLVLRLQEASEYLDRNPDTVAILSGGQGKDEWISEAEAMAKYLENKGISRHRLLIEDESTNTWENIENSFMLIDSVEGLENVKITIVSSEYHIYRAKLLARRQGIEAEGLPAEVPSSVVITSWIREYLALGKSFLLDW